MTDPVTYRTNAASLAHIADHLRVCDQRFVPSLSSRVNIEEYASKISINAQRFEAWAGPLLIGLVAAYTNDPGRRTAFITSVSVLQTWSGRGIGLELMRHCVEYAKLHALSEVALEVDLENHPAIRMYEQCGFARSEPRGALQTMHLKLRQRDIE